MEHDTVFGATFAETLRQAGYDVTGVARGLSEAATLASWSKPQVALVNLMLLPDGDDPTAPEMLEIGAIALMFDRRHADDTVARVFQALAVLELLGGEARVH